MKRLVAVLVAAVLGLSLTSLDEAGAAPADVSVTSYTPTINLGSCGDGDRCANFVVPLDWSNPDGAKITLAVRVHTHTSLVSKGVLLVNPGGPGASGTVYADVLPDRIPGGVGNQYDVVGWDPRGVGRSTPSLHCNSSYFGVNRRNFVPTTHRLMRFWKHKTARYAAACGASSAKALLPHMSTVDNVRDMDALRQALGASKISYYGFSYGTYLGQVYATMFPDRVKWFVFDGVVNPTDYWYRANLKQEIWFDRNLKTFFRWIAKHPGAYHLGRDWRVIKHGYYRLLRKLDRHPAYHRKLGPDEVTDAIINATYYVYSWDYIAWAYSRLVRTGRGAPMFGLYRDGNMGDDNGYAVYLGVQCTDASHPSWPTQRRDAWRIHKKHPYLAWDNTWFNAPCLRWPAASHSKVDVTGASAAANGGRFLLVNETRDAATPYSGALKVRSLFSSSRLIAGVGGTTHAGSLSGVACVDNRISGFLDSGALPPRLSGTRADVSCPKVSPPPAYAGRSAGSMRTSGTGLTARALLPGWRWS
ncbi:MAG TPA: alpha/beta fold hydrolase [Marmoricola sp.]|nr:alpha/beta fold hydrolase [Marmoricola sp.]